MDYQLTGYGRLIGMDAQQENITKLTRMGAPTPQEIKDDVFRIWVEYGRSWALVSKQTGVEVRTLHNWAKADKWDERRAQEAEAFLPGTRTETAIAAQLARHNATVRLQQIAFDAKEHGKKPDLQEVQALKLIAQLGEKVQDVPRASKPKQRRDYRTLDADQLSAAEREMRGDET